MGRMCTYTPEIAAEICEKISSGESLRSICKGSGMPPEATVRNWAMDDVNGFAAQYARARVCVNHIKNVGKVGKVGKHIDLAGEKASQPFLEVGMRLGSGVCRG